MKILFLNIERNFVKNRIYHPSHPTPPLDIGYCSAILEKSGHKTFFLDTATDYITIETLTQQIKDIGADVLVIKPHITVAAIAIRVASIVKKSFAQIRIFCIGPSVTYSPHTFLFQNTPIDACVIGEAEYALVDLIDADNISKADGIAFFDKSMQVSKPRKLIEDLDNLPFPKHELFLNKNYSIYYPLDVDTKLKPGFMQANRGCPFKCTFCSPIDGRSAFGNTFRFRDSEKVVDEIEYLTSFGVNGIGFFDSIFVADKKRVVKTCDLINQRGIDVSWTAETRVNTVDRLILEKMRNAGCSSLSFGIESGSDKILGVLNKVATINQAKRAINLVKDCGIKTVGFFIIGSPSETYSEMQQTLQLALSLPLDMIQVSFFTPFPGSPAYETFTLDGGLDKYNMNNNGSEIKHSPVSSHFLLQFQKYFYKKFYMRPGLIIKYMLRLAKATRTQNLGNELQLLNSSLKYLIVHNNGKSSK